jgi:CspA family cold shock protein
MERIVHRGTVKFFKPDKGWGGIESPEAPGDVWVIFSVIEGPGYKQLAQGDLVEFTYEAAQQDSWNYRATWVRKLPPEEPQTRRKQKRMARDR